MDTHRRHPDEDEDFNSQPEDKLLIQDTNIETENLPTQHSNHVKRSSWRRPLLLIFASLLLAILIFRTLPPGCFTRTGFFWTKDDSRKESGDQYLIGAGKADITGPVVEINLMGYADPAQVGTGLRQRLYSRAFIVGSLDHPADRLVYLVLDTQSGDTAIRYGILNALKDLGPEYAVYGKHNVAVTGTHSHAGPGGWLNYLLPQITSKGFDHQGYKAIVDGAVLSIRRAHESLTPGYLSVGKTKVEGANINRSRFAYLQNPEEERNKYNISQEDDGSVDKDLTLLDFQRASDGKSIGVLTWFATHGTSLLGNNTLIAGDNKGVAAYLFEKSVGESAFVAGFSQANVGDTSPNVLGAWCEDGSGQMCSFENSTCSDGKSQACHARGPFFRTKDNGAESCFEVGRRQFEPAFELYNTLQQAGTPIRGTEVKAFHKFHNMSNYGFLLPNGSQVETCPAALGYSFAAGTSDGPGAFDFTQHDGNENTTSPVWRVVSGMLKEPTQEQRACHQPKPILLDVGEVDKPYQWTPNIVDIQVFRVGQLVIIVSPGEASTMAGRRWRDAIKDAASKSSEMGDEEPIVVLGGPANSYTHYITTEEEYAVQRYEGASTLYGPHTLAAYIHVTLSYLPLLGSRVPPALLKEEEEEEEPFPPDNSNRSLSFISPVVRDGHPLFSPFGSVLEDVKKEYIRASNPTISAKFVGANPRNNLRQEGTYVAVEKLITRPSTPAGAEWTSKEEEEVKEEWQVVRTDVDWDLVFHWRRTSEVMGTSVVEIVWEMGALKGAIPGSEADAGVYRLRYYGDSRSLSGTITPFEGVSSSFDLV
ncbi:Neutral/alkaline nonlysosomal ceramidase [Naviculisporaceae sp. PSN 640]